MRPVPDRAALLGALPGDPLLLHVAGRWVPECPTFAHGGAVGLYCDIWGHPEPMVVGDPTDAVEVVRALVAARPETDWLSAPPATVDAVAKELGYQPEHDWAFRWTDAAPDATFADEAAWLPASDEGEVRALLERGFPDASMPVGHPGVRRWAGVRRDGRLVAVAADATDADEVGFLASIATDPDARGTGAGAAVTAWATAALLAEHPVVGLWHYGPNPAAALYTRLGFRSDHDMCGMGRSDAGVVQ
jgi:GNAT superfamily N-acetyltransferase